MLENENVLDKKGKLLSITKSKTNRIQKEKYGKHLKKKIFLFRWESNGKKIIIMQENY